MAVIGDMAPKINEKGLSYTAEYDFSELREMINAPNIHTSRIKKALDEILKTQIEIFDNKQYFKANVFSSYLITADGKAGITLSKELGDKLIVQKKEFTILELDEYLNLPNNYSKEIYRLLRQFRHTGILYINNEDFKSLLRPPKSYNEYDFIRKVINPAIEANQVHFENLSMPLENLNSLPDVIIIKFTPKKKVTAKLKFNENKKSSNEDTELLKYIQEFTF